MTTKKFKLKYLTPEEVKDHKEPYFLFFTKTRNIKSIRFIGVVSPSFFSDHIGDHCLFCPFDPRKLTWIAGKDLATGTYNTVIRNLSDHHRSKNNYDLLKNFSHINGPTRKNFYAVIK